MLFVADGPGGAEVCLEEDSASAGHTQDCNIDGPFLTVTDVRGFQHCLFPKFAVPDSTVIISNLFGPPF